VCGPANLGSNSKHSNHYTTEMIRANINMSLSFPGKKVKQSHNTLTEAQGETMDSCYSFTDSSLNRGEWSASRPGRAVPPGKTPGAAHRRGIWERLRAGLDAEFRGKIFLPLLGIEPPSPGRLVRSQTLQAYWLSYLRSPNFLVGVRKTK
jgi:hypothetical protein